MHSQAASPHLFDLDAWYISDNSTKENAPEHLKTLVVIKKINAANHYVWASDSEDTKKVTVA